MKGEFFKSFVLLPVEFTKFVRPVQEDPITIRSGLATQHPLSCKEAMESETVAGTSR
jgi:hypothetical protein